MSNKGGKREYTGRRGNDKVMNASEMCEYLGMSRSAFYKCLTIPEEFVKPLATRETVGGFTWYLVDDSPRWLENLHEWGYALHCEIPGEEEEEE